MSQYQLAELVGVQQSAVAKWERGVAEPRMAHKQMLAAVLHQDVFMLFPLSRAERPAEKAS